MLTAKLGGRVRRSGPEDVCGAGANHVDVGEFPIWAPLNLTNY